MGPDGKPWDPARRALRAAERGQTDGGVNSAPAGAVEAVAPASEPTDASKE